MSAIVSLATKRWPGKVPYKIGEACTLPKVWLLARLQEFNAACGDAVLVPLNGEASYIEIVDGSNSPVGRQSDTASQRCQVSRTNLFHEIGHAIGLGHSYFDSRVRISSLFEGVDATAYQQSQATYVDFGLPRDAANASMMAYSPSSFQASPRIQRVVAQAPQRGQLDAARMRVRDRIDRLQRQPPAPQPVPPLHPVPPVAAVAPVAPPKLLRRGSGEIKAKPKFDDLAAPVARRDPHDLTQMSLAELQTLLADIDIVKAYWTFAPGFMMVVSPADVQAVREVLGLQAR